MKVVFKEAVMRRSGRAVEKSDDDGDAESVEPFGGSRGKRGDMVAASIVSDRRVTCRPCRMMVMGTHRLPAGSAQAVTKREKAGRDESRCAPRWDVKR